MNNIIVLCKIPKGSKYYLGIDGDVVSNQIIIVSKIDITKACEHHPHIYVNLWIQNHYPDNNLIQNKIDPYEHRHIFKQEWEHLKDRMCSEKNITGRYAENKVIIDKVIRDTDNLFLEKWKFEIKNLSK